MKKDFLSIEDLSASEINQLIDQSFGYKNNQIDHSQTKPLVGKKIVLIFEKPSLRTRAAFELSAKELGADTIFLTGQEIFSTDNTEGIRESVADVAKNINRWADCIIARVNDHKTLEALASNFDGPVINALSDKLHPTQALADLMTIFWHKDKKQKQKVAFVGDGNNVAVSLLHACAKVGLDFSIASPKGYAVPEADKQLAEESAKVSNAKLEFVEGPAAAVLNADVVYTDVFVSMGQGAEKKARLEAFKNYQVTSDLLHLAKPNMIFMHCLPAHVGEEVSQDVLDSHHSVVFDQAECKLHTAKAVLSAYLS